MSVVSLKDIIEKVYNFLQIRKKARKEERKKERKERIILCCCESDVLTSRKRIPYFKLHSDLRNNTWKPEGLSPL